MPGTGQTCRDSFRSVPKRAEDTRERELGGRNPCREPTFSGSRKIPQLEGAGGMSIPPSSPQYGNPMMPYFLDSFLGSRENDEEWVGGTRCPIYHLLLNYSAVGHKLSNARWLGD